jgi:L,D-peptidoglycan transpeptidase YkuD (ErfK/YbiS/YcfS/YnhG family)
VAGATTVGAGAAAVGGAAVVGARIAVVAGGAVVEDGEDGGGAALDELLQPATSNSTAASTEARAQAARRCNLREGGGNPRTYDGRATMRKRRVRRTLGAGAGLAVAVLVAGCGGPARRAAIPVAPAPITTTPATVRATTKAPPTTAATTTTVAVTTTTGARTWRNTKPAPSSTARPCPPGLAGSLASTGASSQLITVEAPTYTTTTATVSLWQRQGKCWALVGGPWQGTLGLHGFSDSHHEGDPTTPTGAYSIGPVMYGVAPDPGVHYAYHQLVCGDWWDEDPSSPAYNTFEHVPCGQPPPFGGDSEALWQEGNAYPSFAVVDYNTYPVVEGAGSAIFVHADVGGPTNGCVSLPLGELDALLRWLQPAASPLVVMGPDSEISRF